MPNKHMYFSSTDGVKEMKIDRRKCVKAEEEPDVLKENNIIMDVYKHYERKSCFLECRAREIQRICNCLPYHYPNFGKFWKKDTTCNLKGLRCIANITGKYKHKSVALFEDQRLYGLHLQLE